jgi:flagellar biosynthesis/type III secretory pathway protein FliH
MSRAGTQTPETPGRHGLARDLKYLGAMDDTPTPFRPVVHRFRPVVPAEILDAEDAARAVLAAARSRAEALLAETEARVDAAVGEARLAAAEAVEAAAAERIAAAARVAAAHGQALRGALADAVLSVAERVWGDLGADRPAAVARVVGEVRREVEGRSAIKLRVHPADLEGVRGLAGITAVADPSLSPGDCVAEADGTIYDGRATVRAEVALEALAQALAPLREGEDHGA